MSLALGTSMTIRLSLGWSDAYDVMGGDTMLVTDGAITVPTYCGSYYCQAQPRTAIGVQSDGKLLLVVVDGRQARYSLGLSMVGLARLMKRLGAVDALNLDGGGASTMVVNGDVVNRPSDGSLRHVTTAALILPGADADEPA
jgi:exopolysaccharide biosynthesis protein